MMLIGWYDQFVFFIFEMGPDDELYNVSKTNHSLSIRLSVLLLIFCFVILKAMTTFLQKNKLICD
jgi:hypothetical protein